MVSIWFRKPSSFWNRNGKWIVCMVWKRWFVSVLAFHSSKQTNITQQHSLRCFWLLQTDLLDRHSPRVLFCWHLLRCLRRGAGVASKTSSVLGCCNTDRWRCVREQGRCADDKSAFALQEAQTAPARTHLESQKRRSEMKEETEPLHLSQFLEMEKMMGRTRNTSRKHHRGRKVQKKEEETKEPIRTEE